MNDVEEPPVMKPDKADRPTLERDLAWVCALTAGSVVVGFVLWVGLDVLLVRFFPQDILAYNWAGWLFPMAVFSAAFLLLPHRAFGPRVGWSFTSAIVASLLTVVLVLVLGIPIHLANGGYL